MKKRKELDALVSSRATALTSRAPASHSVQELLKRSNRDSDSSDLESSYTVLASYRSGTCRLRATSEKLRRACRHGCSMSWAWLPICLVLLVGAAGALVWLHLGLRQDFDSLRARLRRVDAENKNRLEELQKIRLNIRELKLNLTNTASELQEMSTALGVLTKEVAELKTTASNLQESIASVPQIKGLPNAVKDLKQNVANIGSQVSNLENKVQGLKEQHTTVQTLQKDMEQLKDSVQRVANMSSPEDHGALRPLDDLKQSVLKSVSDTKEVLEQRLDALETGVRSLNTTAESVLESLEHQQEQVEKLRNSSHSTSAEELAPQVLQKTLDKLVSRAVGSPKVTWAETIQECHHMATLYQGVAAQLHVNGSVSNEVEEIMHRATMFVNETVQDVMIHQRQEASPVVRGTEAPRKSGIVKAVGSGSLPTASSAVPDAAHQRTSGSSQQLKGP